MKRFFLVVIFILTIACLQDVYSVGRKEISIEDREEISAISEEILLNAFNSNNYIIKREAVYGMRFLKDDSIYNKILSIFDTVQQDYPGFEILKDTALETLYYQDAPKTIEWLVNYNNLLGKKFSSVLLIFEIQNFFDIIGYDNYYYFDNVYYFLNSSASPQVNIMVLAEQYLATGENKYLLSLYNYFSFFNPEEYDLLFNFFRERNLSDKIIYYNIKESIPFLKTGSNLSFIGTSELEILLFEALLFKYGYTEEVYTKTFSVDNPVTLYKTYDIVTIINFYYGRQDDDITDNMGAEFPELSTSELEAVEEFFSESESDTDEDNFSMINKPITYDMDLGKEGNPSYYLLCDAAAYFFAGAPAERHYNVFVNNFDEQENNLKYKLAEIIAASPSNPVQNRILKYFSESSNINVRTIAFNAYIEMELKELPEQFISIITDQDETIYNRSLLIRAAGNTKNTNFVSILQPLLEHENDLISVTAAGEILHLLGNY